mgnify:CR=1 FL=1
MQFGIPYGINNTTGQPAEEECHKILKEAYGSGVRMLDTADAYGSAQEVVGHYHEAAPPFDVISKLGALQSNSNLEEKVTLGLKKLGVKSFYACLLHSPADLALLGSNNPWGKELIECKQKTLFKKLGVSVYTNADLKLAIENPLTDVIQIPYNLLDNNNQRLQLLKQAKERGKEIHTRSVYMQGLFYMAPDKLPVKLKPLEIYLKRLHAISHELHRDLQSMALQYALTNPFIDHVLIGVDSLEQWLQNKNALLTIAGDNLNQLIDKQINVAETDLLYPYNWK